MAGESGGFAVAVIDCFLQANGLPPVMSSFSGGSEAPPSPAVDMSPVIDSLEKLRTTNQDILQTLQSPTRTAGEEMLDRAWTAYSNGWFDDALRDGEQSVKLYPYRAIAHMLVALASIALGKPESTVASLEAAVRYAVGPELPVGASAVLLFSAIADAAGASHIAIEPLEAFNARSGQVFAEVPLAVHLRCPDDPARLDEALRALDRVGLDLTVRTIPSQLLGLSPQLDAALQNKAAWIAQRTAETGVATAVKRSRAAIAAPSKHIQIDDEPWDLYTHWLGDTVDLQHSSNVRPKISGPLAQGMYSFILTVNGRQHELRVMRTRQKPEYVLFVDDEQVDRSS